MSGPEEGGDRGTAMDERVTLRSHLDQAAARWLGFRTDDGAKFDKSISFDAAAFAPQVTWGTNPGMVTEVTARVPDPSGYTDASQRRAAELALEYMGLRPGMPIAPRRLG